MIHSNNLFFTDHSNETDFDALKYYFGERHNTIRTEQSNRFDLRIYESS